MLKKNSQNFPSVTSFNVPLTKNKLLVTGHTQIQTLLYQSKSTTQDNNQRITISHNRRVQQYTVNKSIRNEQSHNQ